MTGHFITFEGLEGCGKSTQVELLANWLSARNIPVVCTREPGGTMLGEKMRDLLKDGTADTFFSARAELLLFESSRAQHVDEKIFPALKAGKDVLCDRFFDSSLVYQGNARKIARSDIELLNRFATNGLVPDLTVLLDIDPEESVRRLSLRGQNIDRIEQEDIEFFRAVREGYIELAENDSRFLVVDGKQSKEDIQNVIRREYMSRF